MEEMGHKIFPTHNIRQRVSNFHSILDTSINMLASKLNLNWQLNLSQLNMQTFTNDLTSENCEKQFLSIQYNTTRWSPL